MNLIACGINHKTASLDLREKMAFSPEKATLLLKTLLQSDEVDEAVVLSTCNRTEVYCLAHQHTSVIVPLAHYGQITEKTLASHSYHHYNHHAFSHAMRVASGLDSMVLGEPEILGQMKQAVHLAEQEGTCQRALKRFFQQVFSGAKTVRATTKLGVKPLSFAYATLFLAKRIFANLSRLNVLLVGAGDTITQVGRYFANQNMQHIWLANRTLTKAVKLSETLHATAISFTQLQDYLPQADIVVSATASAVPILGKGAIERALKIRKHKPILMIDLALPRDIEPQVAELEDIYLYTIDQLQGIIKENLADRVRAAHEAEKIVDIETARFMRHLHALKSVNVIKNLRQKVDDLQQNELTWAMKKLQAGGLPEEILSQMAKRLTNKLLHMPCTQLRQASIYGQHELFSSVQQLFCLKDE